METAEPTVQPTGTTEVETFLAHKLLSLNISSFCSTVGSTMLMVRIVFTDHTTKYWEDFPCHMCILILFQNDQLLREKIQSWVWERKSNMH